MSDRKFWVFTIFLFSGIIVGSLLGELAATVPGLAWLAYGKSFGLTEPFLLDLNILQLSFGMTFQLNIAGIIGIIIALVLYKIVK
ncbi:MAG: DUF4321 domain-containing protein [Clostridia bacterium]|nr:DUF4321 domain-containing protein [Clostridia bacterium]